jgi:pimeloyl-ACP methyl ester carboxylesterase
MKTRRAIEKITIIFQRAFLIFLLLNLSVDFAGAQSRQETDRMVAKLGKDFSSHTVNLSQTKLHYVRGGTGKAIILLHGFPQNWYEFHKILPRLAKKFTVIAVDLRGIGGSLPAMEAFDAATLANDIRELAQHLKINKFYLAGHDIGGMVAYAYARLYPESLTGVMILDVPLPGVEPWEKIKAEPALWHFAFHQTEKVPELIIGGRELVYFREGFFNRFTKNPQAISDEAARYFAKSYSTPAQLKAGLGFYRAFPANERFNRSQTTPLKVPVVLAGGDNAVGRLNPQIADGLKKLGVESVLVETIKDSGHYVLDEQPEQVAELIERYAQ